ncbi:MAG: beta-propeller domain-containing protein, partial [Dehalococcoidia bacterium]
MKHDDLIHKLENLKTPEIELLGHKQVLKMFLLSSGRFRERTIMSWAKVLAPIATAVLLIAVVGLFAVNAPESAAPFHPANLGGDQINRFASYGELQEFVRTNGAYKQSYWGSPRGDSNLFSGGAEGWAPAPPGTDFSVTDHSTTNVQVAGVDEADIVKTDGEYIYLASQQKIFIMKAYRPEQAQVLSEIKLEGTAIGIFINGDRLVVFEEETPYYDYYDMPVVREYDIMPYISPK